MDNSVIIAQILGLVYLSVGIGTLLSPKHYDKLLKEMQSNTGLLYMGGVMALIFGYIIVYMNNIWEVSYVGAITLVGWMALIKGVLLLIKPDALQNHVNYWRKNMGVATIITIVVGAAFAYYGYIL